MSPEAHGNFSGKQLVVFGCGYVGGELARQARARGMKVTALTRNPAKGEQLKAEGINVVVAELASDDWHRAVQGGVDFVLNAVSSGGGGVEGYRRSYLEGMKSILAWTRTHGPVGVLAYTSSTSVYAQVGGVRVDESSAVEGRDERAALLIATEELLRSNSPAATGVRRAVVLRLGGIYGPGRTHLVEQVRSGEVSGNAAHHLNLIHRDDVVSAVWVNFTAKRTEAQAVYNVTDGNAATKGEVVAWLASQLGVATPKFTGAPAGGRRAVTPDRIIVSDKLRMELGWMPRFPSYRDGYATLLSR